MATIKEIKEKKLHPLYEGLYGSECDRDETDNRFIALLKKHKELFDKESATLFSSAGRTELGGNHTDHNLGKVLAGSINLDTIASVTPREDSVCILHSAGFKEFRVDISDTSVRESEYNTTESLIRGIAAAFTLRGYKLSGWEAVSTTRVLQGSGLSSSAAIEVLCASIFNHLYAEDTLSAVELGIIGQYAENHYFNKPSGLLDQIACAHGGIVAIDFKEKTPVINPIEIDFAEYGYTLAIVDTKGSHADLTGEYASIPPEMKEVAHYFHKECLREVDPALFFSSIAEIRKELKNDRAILRAIHFFNDCDRVEKMIEALKEKDIEKYLSLVNESGHSSFEFLQNSYSIGNTKDQAVPLALALSMQILNHRGACRVHGGGFGGTIQAYVPHDLYPKYKEQLEKVFGNGSVTKLAIRNTPCGPLTVR